MVDPRRLELAYVQNPTSCSQFIATWMMNVKRVGGKGRSSQNLEPVRCLQFAFRHEVTTYKLKSHRTEFRREPLLKAPLDMSLSGVKLATDAWSYGPRPAAGVERGWWGNG